MSEGRIVRPSGSGVKLSYEDYLLFPDDGMRHELIDGAHFVTPSPNTKHQSVSGNLHWLLRSYLEAHPIGKIFHAPFDVVFSDFDVVEPDLVYLSNARAADILTSKHVKGAPDLVVEIESPGTRTRDATIKRQLYERSAVVEYWMVDPEADTISIYRRGETGFAQSVKFSANAGDVVSTPLLPGLELHLATIFKE